MHSMKSHISNLKRSLRSLLHISHEENCCRLAHGILAEARQKVTIKQGIEQKIAKKIIAMIKEAKLKVEAQINGEKLRISAKKREDLQEVMVLLKKSDIELPLQFENFRD